MPDKPYSRNFKFMIAGGGVDNISLYMMLVLFPWLVLTITNSSFLTGLELAMSDLPLSLSFLVGYYLTRVRSKKRLYILATGSRAIILLFIFVVFLTGDYLYDIVALLIGYFLTSWTEDVGEQIGSYWIKEFLDEDQYQRGFSLYGFLNMIIILISYILAGSFIAIGTVYAFPVLILGFTISTVIRSFIKPKSESEGTPEDDRHSFREGISYIWKNKALRYLMIQALLISLAFGGTILVTEVLVKFRYSGSPLILTILLVGAMVGGVFGNKYADKIKGNPRKIMGLLTFTYIPIVLFVPFSPSYIYIIPDFFLLMFTSQIVGVIFHTVFYKATPKDYMLQISGAHKTLALFPSVLSGLIFGAVIQFISLDWAFYLMAIISAAILFVIWKAREIGDFKLE
jgi:MFS family permease